MIYVCLAEGFEEIEALAPVDILRRAQFEVQTVGVTGEVVTGAHGIRVAADLTVQQVQPASVEMLVLPGGMPGTKNLEASGEVQELLCAARRSNAWIAAICAAPSILGHAGLLNGRKATCFPGFEPELTGAQVTGNPVEQDGRLITAKGAGAAVAFGLKLVEVLSSPQKASQLGAAMQCTEI